LEVRVPFLNRDFVDFVNGIRSDMKVRGFKRKFLLKKALEQRLSGDILKRRKKGFELPLASWFRNDLAGFARSVLSEHKLKQHGMLRPEGIKKMIEEHEAGAEENSRKIYSLIMFQKWHDACCP